MTRRVPFVTPLVITLVALVAATGCSSIRTRILINEGNKLYKAQKYEAAIEEYKKILAFAPDNWLANRQVAMSYVAMYHPGSTHPKDIEYSEKAIAAFEKLMTLPAPRPEDEKQIHDYYVGTLRAADKSDKAIAYYESLLSKDPRNTLLMAQVAEIFAKKGDVENALTYYAKRTEVEPQNKEAWYTIGVVCWEQLRNQGPTMSDEDRAKTIETGLKALAKAVAIDPNYFEALVYTGLVYRQQQLALSAQLKNEAAGEAYEKAEEFRKRAEVIGKQRMAERAAKKGV